MIQKKLDEIYDNLNELNILLKGSNYLKEVEKRIAEINNINKQYKDRIDNTIKKCKYLLENEEVEINGNKYYKQKCDDIITEFILQELKEKK